MDQQDLEKIKDRIAKLLRMASDASSPNEAAIAAERARALMDKHQLDSFDVENRLDAVFDAQPATRHYAAIPLYLSLFSTQIAKYNDCQSRYELGIVNYKKKDGDNKQMGKRVMFLGLKSDVELAIQMFNHLSETVNRLCKEYMTKHHSGKYSVKIGGEFKMGAMLAIGNRLAQLTKERDAITSSNGTALVVLKSALVAGEFGEIKYKNVKVKEPDEDDIAAERARLAGIIEGRNVEIIKTVEV